MHANGTERKSYGGSYQNAEEANIVLKLVQTLKAKAKQRAQQQTTPWDSPHNIRIITFYQGQVKLIKKLLREQAENDDVFVGTVDSNQGCEANIVIVSFVRTGRRIGFLADDRRLNVSLTRAKLQLVCVGRTDGGLSDNGCAVQKLIESARQRALVWDAT